MFNLPKMAVPSKFPTRELLSIWQFCSIWQKWQKVADFAINVQFAKNDHSIEISDSWIIIDLTVLFNLKKMATLTKIWHI